MAKGQIKQKQATINKSTFESLCAIQCTKEEICAVLQVSDKTLDAWCKSTYGQYFSVIFAEKKQLGKMSLRRSMFRQAEKNPTMAIWLSKQHLGMKDNIEVESTQLIKVQELLGKIEEEANK
jgi:myosin-crossreactive antigen